jgi:hypothetical protein
VKVTKNVDCNIMLQPATTINVYESVEGD